MNKMLSFLASLPISLKGKSFVRIGGKLFRKAQSDNNETLTTNLGIKDSYKMVMPVSNPLFAFGNPMSYQGERGVLYLSKFLAPEVDAVMDIGANWGYFTYFLKANLNESIPIYFFEPNEKLFLGIQQNVRNNNLKNTHGVQKGISSFSGTAKFYVNLTNDLSSSLDGSFLHEGEQVVEHSIEVVSFDDFISENDIAQKWLVKVDIENAEPEFIKGAANKMGHIDYLIIEFLEKARKGKLADQLTDRFGFHAYYINDFNLEYMPKEDGRYTPPEYNFLFCRLTPEQLSTKLEDSPFTVVK